MKPAPIDDAFFQGKALLLVEDHLTGRVLRECWAQDARAKTIVVRAAGGHVGVSALVNAAREGDRKNVFGLVDLDFATPSLSNSGPVFRTDRHEIENHLLDFDSLAKLASRTTATELRTVARTHATQMQSWMALRRALVEMKRELSRFPSDPSVDAIAGLATAIQWVQQSGYPTDLERSIRRTWTPAHLESMVRQYDAGYAQDLATDQWLTTFSGKELLSYLRSKVAWKRDYPDTAELSFALAQRWVKDHSVPVSVDTLRDQILA